MAYVDGTLITSGSSGSKPIKNKSTVKTGKHLMNNFVPGYDNMVSAGFTHDF